MMVCSAPGSPQRTSTQFVLPPTCANRLPDEAIEPRTPQNRTCIISLLLPARMSNRRASDEDRGRRGDRAARAPTALPILVHGPFWCSARAHVTRCPRAPHRGTHDHMLIRLVFASTLLCALAGAGCRADDINAPIPDGGSTDGPAPGRDGSGGDGPIVTTGCGTCPSGYTCGSANGIKVCRAPSGIPLFTHVFVILMENTSQATLKSATNTPYLAGLYANAAWGSDYHGVTHPSLPNYVALTSGGTQGIGCDCQPMGTACTGALDCNALIHSCGCNK